MIQVKKLDLQGGLLKLVTNKNDNVDLSKLLDKKLLYDFAKEMYFYIKAPGIKSTRDATLLKLHKSPDLMIYASGSSKTVFFTI